MHAATAAASFVLCTCGRPEVHGHIVIPNVAQSVSLFKKKTGLAAIDEMVKGLFITIEDAERLRAEINASALAESLPDALVLGSHQDRLPLAHAVLRINEHETDMVFSKTAAMKLLAKVAVEPGLNDETRTMLAEQIAASQLPDNSDIDVLLECLENDRKEQARKARSSMGLGSILAMIVSSGEPDMRHSFFDETGFGSRPIPQE